MVLKITKHVEKDLEYAKQLAELLNTGRSVLEAKGAGNSRTVWQGVLPMLEQTRRHSSPQPQPEVRRGLSQLRMPRKQAGKCDDDLPHVDVVSGVVAAGVMAVRANVTRAAAERHLQDTELHADMAWKAILAATRDRCAAWCGMASACYRAGFQFE
eukprot:CAMPEP_0117669010 /NCGR_PEP_ID=MMETSP0804-20121206/11879_1 /TAXON_ID=1074897 /ORGANISM="Tetraselmis astigmatica, Strain CCMP880" /LENGTH=155 /DNA_ID=CAMNT_0005476989 /DNA_START=170 /DNA_END=636 /DNA_ORIENTATION=+